MSAPGVEDLAGTGDWPGVLVVGWYGTVGERSHCAALILAGVAVGVVVSTLAVIRTGVALRRGDGDSPTFLRGDCCCPSVSVVDGVQSSSTCHCQVR